MRELDDRNEQTQALRALLAAPFVGAGEPAYALLRRHERELARTLQSTYGYQLEVGSTAARASGPPTPEGLRRPLRIRPASISGRQRPPDEWPALGDRACVLLLLTLVALERGGAQTAIAELARNVERAGADVEPPTDASTSARAASASRSPTGSTCSARGVCSSTRRARTRVTHGASRARTRRCSRSIAAGLRCCCAIRPTALESTTLEQLLDETWRYPPTPEGENRARSEQLARRLTEDPALLLSDLDDEERAYFLGQRARIESAVATATGYQVERRAEGSALIVNDRSFTDVPFPTNATVKQVALLLCDALAATGPGGELSAEALRRAIHELVTEHGRHWSRDAADPAQIGALTDAAVEVLLALRPRSTHRRRWPAAESARSPLSLAGGARTPEVER